eukprot:gene11049-biopygen3331
MFAGPNAVHFARVPQRRAECHPKRNPGQALRFGVLDVKRRVNPRAGPTLLSTLRCSQVWFFMGGSRGLRSHRTLVWKRSNAPENRFPSSKIIFRIFQNSEKNAGPAIPPAKHIPSNPWRVAPCTLGCTWPAKSGRCVASRILGCNLHCVRCPPPAAGWQPPQPLQPRSARACPAWTPPAACIPCRGRGRGRSGSGCARVCFVSGRLQCATCAASGCHMIRMPDVVPVACCEQACTPMYVFQMLKCDTACTMWEVG